MRALMPIGALGATALALDLLGVAGYQAGELLVAGTLALVTGAVAWLAYRDVASRGIWTASLAIAATVLTPVLAARAPWSTGRITAELDRVELPFADELRTSRSGHSWCRPTCPVVERVYLGPAVNPGAAGQDVAAALAAAGLIDHRLGADTASGAFTLTTDDARIAIRAEAGTDADDGRVRITIRIEARR